MTAKIFPFPVNEGFIYIPSIDLYVAKEKTYFNYSWFECQVFLKERGERMLILPEFLEFLKYTRENFLDVYNAITEESFPIKAEFIDARFKIKEKKLAVGYNHTFNSERRLIAQNLEFLDKDTLMEDKKISLEDYLDYNHTSQGLPSQSVKSGNLYYLAPNLQEADDTSVAEFDSDFGGPRLGLNDLYFDKDPSLGVRAVREIRN
jgi:hypothetical protein